MIAIQARTHRSFVFPAPPAAAQAFYSDFRRIVHYLPHISLTQAYDDYRFRVIYSSTELSMYTVHIFADVQTESVIEQQVLHVRPAGGILPVTNKAGLNSLTAQGVYSSQSVFRAVGKQTMVDYSLQLAAELPTPLGLLIMPGSVLNRIADSITKWRMNEIIDGFIARSTADYPHWLALQEKGTG